MLQEGILFYPRRPETSIDGSGPVEGAAPVGAGSPAPPPPADFVVIVVKYRREWLYVRQGQANTLAFPGGAIAPGETAAGAADRVLREKTGAADYHLWPVCECGLLRRGKPSYGSLFFANIISLTGDPATKRKSWLFQGEITAEDLRPDLYQRLLEKVEAWLTERRASVYLLRQGRDDQRPADDREWPLSFRSKEQVKKWLADSSLLFLDGFYASPYRRLRETVAVAAGQEAAVEVIEAFRKRKVADTWLPEEEFQLYSQRQWEDFQYRLPGGDSLADTEKRSVAALLDLLAAGQNILIGTHGSVIGVILRHFCRSFDNFDYQALTHRPAYVVRLEFIDGVCVDKKEMEPLDNGR
ncbi:MAG: histidine phosphatase family protein [Peptococcaceae bacterium]|jgi:2,3-bisphosphoglycerate-dependent phosphoglycerate mutase|nr:histidine phosphatase family protein [Peptococcaceae bacterium]